MVVTCSEVTSVVTLAGREPSWFLFSLSQANGSLMPRSVSNLDLGLDLPHGMRHCHCQEVDGGGLLSPEKENNSQYIYTIVSNGARLTNDNALTLLCPSRTGEHPVCSPERNKFPVIVRKGSESHANSSKPPCCGRILDNTRHSGLETPQFPIEPDGDEAGK